MQQSLQPSRAKPARPRRGGLLTDALKLSPGAAGRSFSALSELKLLTLWVLDRTLIYFKVSPLLDTTNPICGSLVSFPVKYLAYLTLGCQMMQGKQHMSKGSIGNLHLWRQQRGFWVTLGQHLVSKYEK